MNKKQVYADFGIEYKAGKILAPWGAWINPLLTIGTNSKVGDAATFSLLPGTATLHAADVGPKTRAVMDAAGVESITGTCPCDCTGCYAKAGRYRMDGVQAALVLRTIIARFHVDFMRRAISAQCIADKIVSVRIHAAGDFFGGPYVAAWIRIKRDVLRNAEVWTYTKTEYGPALTAAGVSCVPSITAAGINFGTCADVLEKYTALTAAGHRVHVCGCGTPSETHCAECKKGCKRVGIDVDDVLFILHSVPGYKAGEHDATEYKALCEIAARQ